MAVTQIPPTDVPDLPIGYAEVYAGLRQPVPEACEDPRSDTSEESLISQLANDDYRMYLADGCPVRFAVATIGTFDANDHCWADLGNGRLGDLYFYSDPENVVGSSDLAARLDTDATLPPAATSTGFYQGDRELWVDPADDTTVYVVYPDHTEAWPVADISLVCE